MIIDVECRHCYGLGRVHSSGRNGDPMDPGEDCPVCEGTGAVQEDLNDEVEDDDGEW